MHKDIEDALEFLKAIGYTRLPHATVAIKALEGGTRFIENVKLCPNCDSCREMAGVILEQIQR